jgi:transposase
MVEQRDAALADAATHSAARKLLLSMNKHWAGLTVFVEQPWLAMDNNAAERAIRPAVVGRKNFYGSGSQWSGQLAATMYSVLMTARLWGLNARTWLSQYLHACAANGNRAPADISGFLPWAMDAAQLAAMRAVHTGRDEHHGIDSS